MFENELYKNIKENFRVENFDLNFGYGEISSDTEAPYIIQYSLDMDGTRQVLCKNDNYSDGTLFVQWNVYAKSVLNSDFIVRELFKFVLSLKKAGDYTIGLNVFQSNRNFTELNNGLAMSAIALQINYYKEI